jgi:cell division protein ZapA (FtsZ GTPase activity inhibitor)
MDTKDNTKEGAVRIRLKLRNREVALTCDAKDEESLQNAAKQFNDMYSYYAEQYRNIDERDLLCATGFHFAYQLLIQSNINKQF